MPHLVNATINGILSVVARWVVQGQKAHHLPLHVGGRASGRALSNAQSPETPVGKLSDLLGARSHDLLVVVRLFEHNLHQQQCLATQPCGGLSMLQVIWSLPKAAAVHL